LLNSAHKALIDVVDLAFLFGADVYIPASIPPNGTISIVSDPRNSDTEIDELNVPNWASSEDRITVNFNDWLQEVDALPGGKN
jgi:hypothetical protein